MKIQRSWYRQLAAKLEGLVRRRLALAVSLLVAGLVLGIAGAYHVGAEQSGWLDGLVKSTSAPISQGTRFCQVETVEILSSYDTKQPFDTCIIYGDRIDVLASTSYNTMYVRFPGSGNFFRPVQTSINRVSYIPSLDRLVYKSNSMDPHLHVVDNFSSSLQNYSWTPYGGPISYELRLTWNRELQLGDYAQPPGVYQVTNNFVVSADGRVAFVYTTNLNLFKIDLDSGQAKIIERYQTMWYDGMDIPETLASSSDGRYLLLGPMARVIDTGTGCGTPLTESYSQANDCPVRDLGHGTDIGLAHNYLAQQAQFSGGDAVIDVDYWLDTRWGVTYSDGSPSYVRVSFGLAANRQLTYLALGDSYTSGEGDLGVDELGNKYYTTGSIDACHLSKRSYPFLVGALWSVEPSQLHSVACSGALIRNDYVADINTYHGQHGELWNAGQSYDTYVDQALQDYQPGHIPQIEFVKKYQPSVITLTGGGNDVGFADVLAYCAGDVAKAVIFGGDCDYVEGGKLHQFLNDTIDSQFVLTRNLIRNLRAADPTARIYYIGYPSFISDSSTCALNSGLLTKPERQMINQAVSRLNNVIRLATEAEGVRYVDIENSLVGGRLCEGSQYMSGTWDVGPIKILSGHLPSELFHPNAEGHQQMAQVIYSQVPDPLVAMPEKSLDAVTVEPGASTYRARIVKDDTVKEGGMLEIDLAMGSEYALDQVFAVAFSNQVDLGSYRLTSAGSLKQSIALPEDLESGQHLLVIDIKKSDGSSDKLFQYFYIEPRESELVVQDDSELSNEAGIKSVGDVEVSVAGAGRDVRLVAVDTISTTSRKWSAPDQLASSSNDKLTYMDTMSEGAGAGSDIQVPDGRVLGAATERDGIDEDMSSYWLIASSSLIAFLIGGLIGLRALRRRIR